MMIVHSYISSTEGNQRVSPIFKHMGVSENVVYPIVPNGFSDHYPVLKWLAIIGNINPTFSGPNPGRSPLITINYHY